MPLRVSGVPPLLEATTHSVSGSWPVSRRRARAIPSGSVLSMKSIRIRSVAGSPRASATNIGPSAEPPIPMDSTPVNRAALGGRICPPWTPAANALTSAMVLRISAAISGVGARSGFRSQ